MLFSRKKPMNDHHSFNSTNGSGSGGDGECFPWKTVLILAVIYEIRILVGQCKYG